MRKKVGLNPETELKALRIRACSVFLLVHLECVRIGRREKDRSSSSVEKKKVHAIVECRSGEREWG